MPPRADPTGLERDGVFATPAAVRGVELPAPHVFVFVRTDPRRPDTIEQVRNAAAALDPRVAGRGAAAHAHRRASSPSCAARC